VSKEDVIGVLTAIEIWFGRDEAVERQCWYDDLQTIRARLSILPGAGGEVLEPTGMDRVPRLKVFWDTARYPLDGLGLRQRLMDGEPRIMLDDNSAADAAIAIDPFQLQPGEAATVGEAIAKTLAATHNAERPASPPPAATVAGAWDLQIDFMKGARRHRLDLEQSGAALSGRQQSDLFAGPVAGRLAADRVEFHFDGRYEGARIMYRFDGAVADGAMSGRVTLGAASDTSPGPVNLAQFGTGEWRAERVA
jgi:D-glucosaminate-6-phosphate ammonia-lyase